MEGRRQPVDMDQLLVEIPIAVIGALVPLGQRPPVQLVEEIGDAVDRYIVVPLMNVSEGQAGRAACRPRFDVVRVAPPGRAITGRKRAATIPDHQRAA